VWELQALAYEAYKINVEKNISEFIPATALPMNNQGQNPVDYKFLPVMQHLIC